MTEKRMPAAERATGKPRRVGQLLQSVVSDNRPDTDPGGPAGKCADGSGESVRRKMTTAPKPEDKLDAATHVVVNGRSCLLDCTVLRRVPPARPLSGGGSLRREPRWQDSEDQGTDLRRRLFELHDVRYQSQGGNL